MSESEVESVKLVRINKPRETIAFEKTSISIYYDDEETGLVVLHKPSQLMVDGEYSVQQLLLSKYEKLHLVHQIDFSTSGIMIMALNKKAAAGISKLFEKRKIKKMYTAVVRGWVEENLFSIKLKLREENQSRMYVSDDGKDCETLVHVLKRGFLRKDASSCSKCSYIRSEGQINSCSFCEEMDSGVKQGDVPVTLVNLDLKTGRRHQLRVHLSAIGHPIVGDLVYEENPPEGRVLGSQETLVENYWPFKKSVKHRMLLHSEYMLIPLHKAKIREWNKKDLAISIPSKFEELVVCPCSNKSEKCQCASNPGSEKSCITEWEYERNFTILEDLNESNKKALKKARMSAQSDREKQGQLYRRFLQQLKFE